MHSGQYSFALPLLTEQLETLRGAAGSADNPRTLGAAHDLATLHTQMQKYLLQALQRCKSGPLSGVTWICVYVSNIAGGPL